MTVGIRNRFARSPNDIRRLLSTNDPTEREARLIEALVASHHFTSATSPLADRIRSILAGDPKETA